MPFLDRAIPAAVAEQLAVPLAEARPATRRWRASSNACSARFVMMGGMYGGAILPCGEVPDEAAFLAATEQIIRRHAACGAGVILGRAGMIVLADHPHVVRVRLSGRVEARIEQAMRALRARRASRPRRQERENDGARAAWVQRFYGRDVDRPVALRPRDQRDEVRRRGVRRADRRGGARRLSAHSGAQVGSAGGAEHRAAGVDCREPRTW